MERIGWVELGQYSPWNIGNIISHGKKYIYSINVTTWLQNVQWIALTTRCVESVLKKK
jgi:hypothetical protein